METEVTGLGEALEDLGKLQDRADKPIKALEREITRWLLARQRERFESMGASAGAPWPVASPQYLKLKAAILGGDVRPLRWGGLPSERLYPSLTQEGHPEQIIRVDDDGIEMGTRVPYAAQLQAGGVDPFGVPYGGHDLTSLSSEQQGRLFGAIDTYITTGKIDEEWQR